MTSATSWIHEKFGPLKGERLAVPSGNRAQLRWLFFSFDGRIERRAYWLALVLLPLAVIAIGILLNLSADMTLYVWALVSETNDRLLQFIFLLLNAVLAIAGFFSLMALMIKRLNDANWPGWLSFAAIFFAIIPGALLIGLLPTDD